MRRTRFSKLTSVLVATAHLLASVFMVVPAQAQVIDVDPPTIELEAVDEGIRGETQVFSATVEDNNEVSMMTLHYRFGNTSNYQSVPMSPIAGTSIYTASVDTSDTSITLIQYYMEARDSGGNRTVQGFAFDPFERVLVEQQEVVATAPAGTAVVPAAPVRMSTQRKVIYGLLGVLVVGGLVAASSSSSGSGGGADEEVDLTIFVDRF